MTKLYGRKGAHANVPHWLADLEAQHPNQVVGISDAVLRAQMTVTSDHRAVLGAWAEARQEVVRFLKVGHLTDREAAHLLVACDQEERRATA